MLWSTLWTRIGKQPVSFTNHNHVKAVIDGQICELDLKYDAKGRPYLVKKAEQNSSRTPAGVKHPKENSPT